MAQTCSKCSRANPADAVYCYYDGFVLAGHSQNGGPVAVGSKPFGHPFVFPTGRHCRNFNELALACVEDWDAARDLLRQGYLETFLGGLGRIDLVLAAKESAKFPDADRGLDQLLDKLPSDTLGKPQLAVETQEINLGVVPVGTERQFQLHLENQGMRLLYGTVSCPDKAPWLTIGDTPNTLSKSVQFGQDLRLTIKVAPDRLRAGNKPLEGTLVVETNGGTAAVKVRAEVPVKPFPPGVLGGAKTPREVAVKAKAHHKEVAALFEDGTVAAWYKDNGWTYPVQGPSSSGIGAIQQFYEALGLVQPPKVSISDRKIQLRGDPGAPLRYTVKVETQEKRPVYAHGSSNVPWLEVGRAKLAGRSATINLSVPAVPNRPGETLTAQLVVQSNGNQRFVVPVTLQVSGQRNGAPVLELGDVFAGPEVVPVEPVPVVTAVSPVVPTVAPAPPPAPAAPITPAAPMNVATAPMEFGAPPPGAPIIPRRVQRSGSLFGLLLHGVPAALLAFCLLLILCWDVANRLMGGEPSGSGGPRFVGSDKDKDKDDSKEKDKALVANTDPLIGVNFNTTHRFGIEMLKEEDPKVPGAKKRLTFKQEGGSNNTCVLIDGSGHLFGLPPGKGLTAAPKKVYKNRPAWESTWDYTTEKVKVRQYVEIVPGEQSRRLDTVLVWYTVENYGTVPRTVGLRMMLDTFIGANDGVPFLIAGQKGLLTDLRQFGEKDIPDYVEALEFPDLEKPGTVAHIGLKGVSIPGVDLEPVHEMLICRWPGSETRWRPEKRDIRSIEGEKEQGEVGDSCVFIYWSSLPMPPKTTRNMAFTYGLGKMAASPTGGGGPGKTQLALTSGGSFQPGGVFTVTAYVKGGKEGQKVKLSLPSGLSFVGDEPEEKAVDAPDPKAGYSQVSWRVKAKDTGEYELKATSGGVTARDKVKIKIGGVFGSD